MKSCRGVYLHDRDGVFDIEIDDGGIIRAVSPSGEPGSGQTALPSLFDFHVHTREPGYEYKEDIASAIGAARRGGFSGFLAMPNTDPVCDSAAVLRGILQKAAPFSFDFHTSAAITKGQKGRELCDFGELALHGAAAFTDDGMPVEDAALMRRAMREAYRLEKPLLSHCEIKSLSAGGCINEGEVSRGLGVQGIPTTAEDIMIARDLLLAGETQAPVHIAHVSTKSGVQMIRQAKKYGIPVTAETCPHYFSLTEQALLTQGVMAKMSPPLRTEQDRMGIIEGLCDGTIDMISTDHAPHSNKDKHCGGEDALARAANGVIGLESAFSVSYTYLVRQRFLTLARLMELMSHNPRERLRRRPPRIAPGEKAEFFTAELSREYCFGPEHIRSKSKNSPYIGAPLYGEIRSSYVGIEIDEAD